jgi:hypothetical protein
MASKKRTYRDMKEVPTTYEMSDYEKLMYNKRLNKMLPEEKEKALKNHVFYLGKGNKFNNSLDSELMCRCDKVKKLGFTYHRYRECTNARCEHKKESGNGYKLRKVCIICSPHNFCTKCTCKKSNKPMRLSYCKCDVIPNKMKISYLTN